MAFTTGNPKDKAKFQSLINELDCCNETKKFVIQIKTPQGIQAIRVCEKHRRLDYFQKYTISEVPIQ